MVRPCLDFEGDGVQKVELDYLRLIYAVSELRKQHGDDAEGYVVAVTNEMLNRFTHLERDYHGKEYAQLLSVSLESYLRQTGRSKKTEVLSGIVRAAVLEKGDGRVAGAIHRAMREFILRETISGLEPDVQQIKDKDKFPFRIRWDYYGIVETKAIDRPIDVEVVK
jgi:hypothetical protein